MGDHLGERLERLVRALELAELHPEPLLRSALSAVIDDLSQDVVGLGPIVTHHRSRELRVDHVAVGVEVALLQRVVLVFAADETLHHVQAVRQVIGVGHFGDDLATELLAIPTE
ncbi:MAG: hypothetical protein WD638_05925 [Nitriliruptoraceae bacterium]